MSRVGLYKALSAEGNSSFVAVIKVALALVLGTIFESSAENVPDAP
jgi:DNA-binding phage protein